AVSGFLVAGAGMVGNCLAWEEAAKAASQPTGVTPSTQGAGGTTTVLVPQCQVVYETVQSLECVRVPVTHMQTHYRTECRTESVPVTRMIPEVVNENRTIYVCVPKEETIKRPVTRIVCEPVTVTKRFQRPIPVTKNVEKVVQRAYCTTVMKDKV